MSLFLYIVYALCVYNDAICSSKYFTLGVVGLSAACALVYALQVRVLQDPKTIFLFGLSIDIVIAISFFGVPFLIHGVKFTKLASLGIVLVVVGLGLINYGK